MVNYVHPSRRPACNAPSLADLTADRFAEAREQGYAIAERATAAAYFATLPYEQGVPTRYRATRRMRYLLALLLCILGAALGWAGVSPTAAHSAPVQGAPDTMCWEDMPCWDWTQYGNGMRGVVLKRAPRTCAWHSARTGCVTVVTVVQYCHMRKRDSIDRTRTSSLKGDGWARDHGCASDGTAPHTTPR